MYDTLLRLLGNLILSFFNNKSSTGSALETIVNISNPTQTTSDIDWTNGACKVSNHFTVAEAITLHSWNRLANESDGLTDQVKAEIVKLCSIMDQIRDLIGCPMNVHCIFRSVQYNQEVLHSLPKDVHSMGMAIDWDANSHYTIEQAKEKIRPVLEQFGLRLEGGTTTWIHNDTHALGPSGREFKA